MATLNLEHPWTYRTPLVTRPYPAGKHRVTADIFAKAVADGATKEETNGDTSEPAEAGAAHDPDNGES